MDFDLSISSRRKFTAVPTQAAYYSCARGVLSAVKWTECLIVVVRVRNASKIMWAKNSNSAGNAAPRGPTFNQLSSSNPNVPASRNGIALKNLSALANVEIIGLITFDPQWCGRQWKKMAPSHAHRAPQTVCPRCTFINPAGITVCMICDAPVDGSR